MEWKYTVPNKLIRAALKCAAKNDVRHYLNGVYIEVLKSGTVIAVATDGHRMFVGWEKGDQKPKNKFSLIVARQDLEAGLKVQKDADLMIADDRKFLKWASLQCEPMDGKFPDWRAVIPGQTFWELPKDQTVQQFNTHYVRDAHYALAHMAGAHTPQSAMRVHPVIRYGKSDSDAAIMVLDGVDALVVLMPLRADEVPQPRVPEK